MPVHEIKYRAWEGELTPSWRRLLAIPNFTLMSVFNRWLAMFLFGAGVVQFLAYTGMILITNNPLIREALDVGTMPQLPPHRIYQSFYLVQFFIVVIITLMAAPKMISPEIAQRALPIIYSRPLTRRGYILGKCAALALLISWVTWIQVVLLFIAMIMLYPEGHEFWTEFYVYQVPLAAKAILLGMLMTVMMTTIGLGCGSVTKNERHVAVMLLILVFCSSFLTNFVHEVIYTNFPSFGPRDLFYDLAQVWLDPAPDPHLSGVLLVLIAACWIAGFYALMRWRLQPVEIYKE